LIRVKRTHREIARRDDTGPGPGLAGMTATSRIEAFPHRGRSRAHAMLGPPAQPPPRMTDALPHILVVDDDPEIGALLVRYLGGHGFAVDVAADGARMRAALAQRTVDAILLDLGLPGEDGLTLLRGLRQTWHGPVIVISGRGESVERVVGLELGADDYVTKPFDFRELLARLRSVLRRAQAPAPAAAPVRTQYEFDRLRLDVEARRLLDRDGRDTGLTTGEFELLLAFVGRPNQVLSRDQLMNALHGRDAGPMDRTIDVQVGRLRRKIEADPTDPQLIRSVRGAGYVFTAPVRRL
jgi:two-component system OmpR family response regulator